MSRKTFYIYMLLNPLNFDLPFYVGKGSGNRAIVHFKEKFKKGINYNKFNLIQKIFKETGKYPKIEIYRDNLSEDEAFFLEEELIAFYGRKDKVNFGILTNLTDGGEDGSGHIVNENRILSLIERNKKTKKNMISVRDIEGNTFSVSKDDPRWISGELVGVTKGLKISEKRREKMKFRHLGKKWYNNGISETFALEQPEDYNLGRLKREGWNSSFKGKKLSQEHITKLKEQNTRRLRNELGRFIS